MTSPLRVVVADDSPTARKRLVDALSADPGVLVVGEASNGEEAIERCATLHPDVLTLDLEMPKLHGIGVTEAIMMTQPTPILIVSAEGPRSESVRRAIEAGAVDALEKRGIGESDAAFDARLLRAVRLVAKIRVVTRRAKRVPFDLPPEPSLRRRSLVVIGGSTGGPSAVVELLTALPKDFPLPILLVLHLGHTFGYGFAEWLGSVVKRPVAEIAHGALIQPGLVQVCPPDRHLTVRGTRLLLNSDPERNYCRPSVDIIFESVAEELGAAAIGCLLTGIGRDGAEGLLRMRRAGALTMAQDEASSTVFGMPRAAIELGAATHVASPAEMAARLASAARTLPTPRPPPHTP